jgi:hypothetical protein
LGYAVAGGIGKNQKTMNRELYGGNDITVLCFLLSVYAGLVDKLTENGAKGVVANFPYYYTIFTTVPHNPVPLTAGLRLG